jgi:integrase
MASVPRSKTTWVRVESGIRKRTNHDGSTVYEVRVRRKGRPERTLTCPTLREARKLRDQARHEAWEGKHNQGHPGRRKTVSELCEEFLQARYGDNPTSYTRTHKEQLHWWCGKIGELRLHQVTPAELSLHRDELAQHVTPATVHRYLAALSSAFTWACQDERQWLQDNPVRRVSRPEDTRALEVRERRRFLSADERERLLQACRESRSSWLYEVVLLALSTGARRGEILNLCWKNLDLAHGHVWFHNTKNGEDRRVPLVGPVVDVLLERHHAEVTPHPETLLFPAPDGIRPVDIRTAWRTALKNAGIENFKFHDLRHTTASYLRLNGHSLGDIADVLGHKSLTVTRRYAHLDDSYQRKMLGSTMGKIFGRGDGV